MSKEKMHRETSEQLIKRIDERLSNINKGLNGETIDTSFSQEEIEVIERFIVKVKMLNLE